MVRYAVQPLRIASSRASPVAVRTRIGVRTVKLEPRSRWSTVQPSTRGIIKSKTIRSGDSSSALSIPLRPSAAVKTFQPFARRYSAYI